jgi:hypothetical protein
MFVFFCIPSGCAVLVDSMGLGCHWWFSQCHVKLEARTFKPIMWVINGNYIIINGIYMFISIVYLYLYINNDHYTGLHTCLYFIYSRVQKYHQKSHPGRPGLVARLWRMRPSPSTARRQTWWVTAIATLIAASSTKVVVGPSPSTPRSVLDVKWREAGDEMVMKWWSKVHVVFLCQYWNNCRIFRHF